MLAVDWQVDVSGTTPFGCENLGQNAKYNNLCTVELALVESERFAERKLRIIRVIRIIMWSEQLFLGN